MKRTTAAWCRSSPRSTACHGRVQSRFCDGQPHFRGTPFVVLPVCPPSRTNFLCPFHPRCPVPAPLEFLFCRRLSESTPRACCVRLPTNSTVPSTTSAAYTRCRSQVLWHKRIAATSVRRGEGVGPAQIVPVLSTCSSSAINCIFPPTCPRPTGPAKHPLADSFEQPSEVNSSTTTGVRTISGVAE